jgi:hypothetical protein
MNVGTWSDSGIDESKAWGKLLADVARHIGNALHEQSGKEVAACVEAVTRAFLDELGEPTSNAQGGFHERPH